MINTIRIALKNFNRTLNWRKQLIGYIESDSKILHKQSLGYTDTNQEARREALIKYINANRKVFDRLVERR